MRRALALLCLALLLAGCGEEAEVRVVTQVFPDGSLRRTARLDARDPKRDEPYPADWLASGPGLILAAPEAWDSVETLPTGIRVDGFFAAGEPVPPLLAHRGEDGDRADRGQVTLVKDDLVILDRFTFQEIVGDPYGAPEMGKALDALLDAVASGLRRDLRRQFGPDVATQSAETYIRKGARGTLLDLLTALRETQPDGKRSARVTRLVEVHAKHRLPLTTDDPDRALEADVAALIDRIAAELVRANPRLDAAALTAFVAGEGGAVTRILDDPEVAPSVEAVQAAFFGAYGLGSRARFLSRIALPGRVLRTNGTLDGDAVVFTFDQDDMASRDTVLDVESVDLNGEALTRLGARRDLEAAALLRVVDLLVRPDLAQPLREALARAVETGSFRPLREGIAGDTAKQAGAELADMLDPSAPRWPAP
jgi:hypothetical protein